MPSQPDSRYILPVTQGGTGANKFSSGGVIVGNGSGPLQAVSSPTLGTVPILSSAGTVSGVPCGKLGDTWNLALKLVAGRLTLTSSTLQALSSSNLGYCRIPFSTGGSGFFKFNYDHYFDDATAADSDIIGEEFGTTAGVAWGNNRPIYAYACNVSDDVESGGRVFISPNPTLTTSPSAGTNIGYWDNVAATPSDSNAFFWCTENATNYTSKPCVLIGSFTATKNTSDDWTVSALASTDGIGKFNEATVFTFPTNQMGASTGTRVKANGGTPPAFTTEEALFTQTIDGWQDYKINLNGDGGTDGAGAVNLKIATPAVLSTAFYTSLVPIVGSCLLSYGAGPTTTLGGLYAVPGEASLLVWSGTATLTNADFPNAARFIQGQVRIKVF